jgi:hypothetical protein
MYNNITGIYWKLWNITGNTTPQRFTSYRFNQSTKSEQIQTIPRKVHYNFY